MATTWWRCAAGVAKILGMDRNYTAVLVGVGNIGRALVKLLL